VRRSDDTFGTHKFMGYLAASSGVIAALGGCEFSPNTGEMSRSRQAIRIGAVPWTMPPLLGVH